MSDGPIWTVIMTGQILSASLSYHADVWGVAVQTMGLSQGVHQQQPRHAQHLPPQQPMELRQPRQYTESQQQRQARQQPLPFQPAPQQNPPRQVNWLQPDRFSSDSGMASQGLKQKG